MLALLRLGPNWEYPSHAHDHDEEFFVIEVDLEFPDYQLKAGSYLRMQAGTPHVESRTFGVCT
jgi:quercetin dioxygenase-like cupin family protein